jgi:hypothetical protein
MTSFRQYLKENTTNKFGDYIDIEKDKEVKKILKDSYFDISKIKVKNVHKDTIKNGDTIIYDGKVKTVNNKYIKKDELMGVSIFGYNFNNGKIPVQLVIFK